MGSLSTSTPSQSKSTASNFNEVSSLGRRAPCFSVRKPGFASQSPLVFGPRRRLEGYITAKALVAALRLAGPKPTRESFIKAVESAGNLPLADGLRASYQPGNHEGLSLVTLAIYTREGRFITEPGGPQNHL
jgi:hypothetical protein